MAEPSEDEMERILGVFLPEYNAKRSTCFCLDHWSREGQFLANHAQDRSCDCLIRDPKGFTLKVQLTRPPFEGIDYSLIADESRFLRALRMETSASCFRGCLVTCSYKSLPKGRADVNQLAQEMMRGLGLAWDGRRHLGDSRYEIRDLRAFGEASQRFIYSLTVLDLKLMDADPRFMIGYYLGTSVPSASFRMVEACLKKAKRYCNSVAKELILIVHFDLDPFDGGEIDEMVARVHQESIAFREVWAICNLNSNAPRVCCLMAQK